MPIEGTNSVKHHSKFMASLDSSQLFGQKFFPQKVNQTDNRAPWTDKTQKQITIAMILDFCKAFDCFDHQILYQKRKIFKIEGSFLQLHKSFFVERRQFVSFSNKVPKNLVANLQSNINKGYISTFDARQFYF